MNVYVFTGPTLSAEDAAAELDARYLPPVAQGDVYRVAATRPRAIGIIDGYFERVPAVWHKEILWALSQGIPVFGSASMGALRAAELAPFGMHGVGEIFESYRDGWLEDDDEVALTHGSADEGYRPLSEAMVNIRSTLRQAAEAGVIGASTRTEIEHIAKTLFYPDRDYPALFKKAAEAGVDPGELAALSAWLPAGRVDQKRIDAIAMLRAMRVHLADGDSAFPPSFFLEYTVFLDHLVKAAGQLAPGTEDSVETIAFDSLLDEMLLDDDLFAWAHQGALARHLAITEAQRQGLVVDDDALEEGIAEFSRLRGLTGTDLERWIAANHLDQAQFRELMRDEILIRRLVVFRVGWDVRRRVADQLRLIGVYDRLATRAGHKQRTLDAFGLHEPSLDEIGLTFEALLAWYAERTRHPGSPSAAGRVAVRRFANDNRSNFTRALLREFCYLTIQEENSAEDPSP